MLDARGEAIGVATNNVAEYRALVAGLEAPSSSASTELEVVSDSELLVKQMRGEYRVKNAALRELSLEAAAARAPDRRRALHGGAPRAQRARRPPRQRGARRCRGPRRRVAGVEAWAGPLRGSGSGGSANPRSTSAASAAAGRACRSTSPSSRRRAEEAMSEKAFAYVAAGAGLEETMRANREALRRVADRAADAARRLRARHERRALRPPDPVSVPARADRRARAGPPRGRARRRAGRRRRAASR